MLERFQIQQANIGYAKRVVMDDASLKLEKPKEEISKKHENTASTLGQVKGKMKMTK